MANLIIKSSADNLVLQGSDASPAITVGATGTTTFAENATFSGTANNIGTVTAGTLGSAVVGGQAGTCYFYSAFSTSSGWHAQDNGDVVPFDSEEVDDDSCTSVTGGTVRFTAPANGIYSFGFALYVAQSDATNGYQFYVDGAIQDRMASGDQLTGSFEAWSSAADHILNGSQILKLTANQYVTVNAGTDGDVYAGHSGWWGCRLR